MKAMVLFYSMGGSTRFVAQAVAVETGAELLEIKRKKEFRQKGFLKFFVGGFEAIFKRKPAILPLEKDLSGYDLIFIGTPVWGGKYNPVFNSLLPLDVLKEKSVALFCTCDGGVGKTFAGLKKLLDHSIVVGEKVFISPAKKNKDSSGGDIKAWAQGILKSL